RQTRCGSSPSLCAAIPTPRRNDAYVASEEISQTRASTAGQGGQTACGAATAGRARRRKCARQCPDRHRDGVDQSAPRDSRSAERRRPHGGGMADRRRTGRRRGRGRVARRAAATPTRAAPVCGRPHRRPSPVHVALGTPAHAILDAAHGADLVIMGLRRERLIERIVHDATTPHVVRECSVPVLAVTPDLRGMPRTVVVASDFSPESNAAARLACRLFTGCARLVFVHIESDFDVAIANLDEITRMVHENGWAAAFQRLIETLPIPAGATVETVVVRGTVPRSLLSFAKRRGADVLVVGRQQHDVAERVLVGSVTAGLVRRAPCSLLITPPTV